MPAQLRRLAEWRQRSQRTLVSPAVLVVPLPLPLLLLLPLSHMPSLLSMLHWG